MKKSDTTAMAIARNEGKHWGLNQKDDSNTCPFDDRFPDLRDAWNEGFADGRKSQELEDQRLQTLAVQCRN